MSQPHRASVLAELLRRLELEKIEENLFRGDSQDLGFGAIFGGQVLGQSLSAASQTVPEGRVAHSLHAYFLRAGDARRPVVYQVEATRDGRSFSTRRVTAIQKGRPIFTVTASFQVPEEGFEHRAPVPAEVPGPEGLESELDIARRLAPRIPAPLRAKLTAERPIELRQVNPVDPFAPDLREPRKHMWIRAAGPLPESPAIHRYLLAYASDFQLVGASLLPHGHTFWEPTMKVASVDHAIWFHRPFRMDEWLLHSMDSPSASGGRGFNRGQIFTRDGVLVASVAQEGLIRLR